MHRSRVEKWHFLAGAVFAVTLGAVFTFPMMTDEAYYMDWARRSTFPALGFFDHPPFVSWQAILSRFFHSLSAARAGVWLASLLTFYFNWRTAHELWNSKPKAWTAAVLAHISLGGLANAILLTPDSGLALWWSIALHEALAAQRGRPLRWLSAGAAVGLGLLAKYTMVLIGPVFLFALLSEGNRQLRTPWPYLGGLVALFVFLPNILWNSANQWTTFRFQFGHGFSLSQSLSSGSALPEAMPVLAGSPSYVLYQNLQHALNAVPGFEETRPKERPTKTAAEQAWQYVGDYLGGVAALWGVLIFFLLRQLYLGIKRIMRKDSSARPQGLQLIKAAVFWPLFFFLLVSPFSRVEANWVGMHMAAGAILAVGQWRPSLRTLRNAFCFHAVLLIAIIATAMVPNLAPFARSNRVIVEAAGYDQLSDFLKSKLSTPLLAVDSYQLKSAFAARMPEVVTVQWPRITRLSEYTRGGQDDGFAEQMVLASHEFHLLTFEDLPPNLPGFVPVTLEGIRSCPDGTIGSYGSSHPILPCENGLKDWWLVLYRRES